MDYFECKILIRLPENIRWLLNILADDNLYILCQKLRKEGYKKDLKWIPLQMFILMQTSTREEWTLERFIDYFHLDKNFLEQYLNFLEDGEYINCVLKTTNGIEKKYYSFPPPQKIPIDFGDDELPFV